LFLFEARRIPPPYLRIDAMPTGRYPKKAAMVAVARYTGVAHLQALCHVEHTASQNVLKKNGFMPGEPPTQAAAFPNLAPGLLQDALSFVLQLRVDHAPPTGNGKRCWTA